MKPEAQPLRITAGTEPAKSGFIRGDFGCSAKPVHLSDGRFQVRDAEVHEKPPGRIASVYADFKGGSLKPSLCRLANGMELPTKNICSRNDVDFEGSETPISMKETSALVGAMPASIASLHGSSLEEK
jgi:hypothetical protein